LEKLKLVTAIVMHIDLVTAISGDNEYILAGSRDTTLSLWKARVDGEGKVEGVSEPIWHLRGHQSGLRQCALLWLLQVAISLGENGVVLLHSLRTGFCVRKLFAFLELPHLMDVSKSGLIAFNFLSCPRQISIFSLNGLPVKTLPDTPSPLHTLVFSTVTDSLVLATFQCLQLISVFEEFRTEEFILPAECKLEVCGFSPGEQSLLRLVKQGSPQSRSLVAEQIHSASQLVDFLVKHGF
jgi:WD40 repeat protein